MKDVGLIIILVCWIPSLINCVPRRKKSASTQTFHRTGEPIAVDDLIKKYEAEHQKLYKELIKEDNYLGWPALDNKYLSKYCQKYLQHTTPAKTNDDVTGNKIIKTLHYEKENTSITADIVMVQCKIRFRTTQLILYMTRAPEPNCVYALKCSGALYDYNFSIIHKHCDFEMKPFINRSLKRKRSDFISGMHHGTGQPIATDEYLLKYELEHQKMLKTKGENGKRIQWPHAATHNNLNLYCYKYIRECCPNRKSEGISGSWSHEKLHYGKLNTKDVFVTVITCVLQYASKKLQYYTTRAPETNCVYTLVRIGRTIWDPLVIMFKHCDFEDSLNDQQTNSEDNDIHIKEMIPSFKGKKET